MLEKTSFELDVASYNVPQATEVTTADLTWNKYEGTFAVSWHHAIETEDEDFKAAFVRPVSIKLQDDSLCPDGGKGYDDQTKCGKKVRKCGCRMSRRPLH